MDENTTKLIHTATQALAGVCDFAYEQDGAGFNKFDADFGHSLAAQASLSEGQAIAALKMLQKYRKQLAEYGITLPEMDVIERPQANSKAGELKSITLDEQLILFYYNGRPNDDEMRWVKALPDRRWYPERPGKPWGVPVKHISEVLDAYENVPELIDEKVTRFAKALDAGKIQVPTNERITLEDGYVYIYFEGKPPTDQLNGIRNLSERKWIPEKEGKPWRVPARLLTEVVEMLPDHQLDSVAVREYETQKQLVSMSRASDSDFDVEMKGGTLLPYQRAGVEFLEITNGRAIIADEMGLGKTIQALAYLQLHPELRPAIIVVPSSLKINWEREANKWLSTGDDVEILQSQAPYETTGSILVINYDILSYWVEHLLTLDPKIFIADESHYMKNSKSLRAQAGAALAEKIDRTILLTGTPLTNRPSELYPQLAMIDPKAWPSFWRFAHRYCNAQNNGFGWDFNGASNLDELHEIIKPYVVRRTKVDVLTELPEKRRSTVYIEFDPKMREEYYQLVWELTKTLDESTPGAQLAMIEKLKQAAVRGKMKYAVEWIGDFLDTNGKLVVFCTHNWTVDALMKKFGDRAVKVTGSVTGQARQDAVDAFQNDENVRLFVGNIKAAGVGITLTAASDVAFLEFAWTPGDMEQAIDRTHRIGQRNSVTAWYLVAEGTIDEPIVELLQEKAVNIHAVMDNVHTEFKFGILNELVDELQKVIAS